MPTYNPYRITHQSNNVFTVRFKGRDIVMEGRQDPELSNKVVESLNDAFTRGVQDVKGQLDPIIDQQADRISELENLLSKAMSNETALQEQYEEAKAQAVMYRKQLTAQ